MLYGSYHVFVRDCDLIYTHLTKLRQTADQNELIDRFRQLFVLGLEYPEPEILAALHRIVKSPWAEREFNNLLNRCCYILINYWWLRPDMIHSTESLVRLLQSIPSSACALPAVQRLRQLVQRFQQTPQFAGIQDRLKTATESKAQESPDASQRSVRDYIAHYPFLYSHLLTTWDSSEEGRNAIRRMQLQKEKQFEDELHRYCTVLRRQQGTVPMHRPGLDTHIGGSKNPTQLDDAVLENALRQYAGKARQGRTSEDWANDCRQVMMQAKSFKLAKREMHEYLTVPISSRYTQHRFGHWLEAELNTINPHLDQQVPHRQLLKQLCSELLASLLANPQHNASSHLMFVDLNHNVGPTATIGFLLQILLLLRGLVRDQWEMIKAYVSQFFAGIFRHYQAVASGEVEWLLGCLEHLQVAFAVHSDRTDFSWVHR
jgi:hypothetical protein